MWYELYINKNLDLGIIFDVSLFFKKRNLCNTHFTIYTGPFCTFVGKRMLVQSLCITNLKIFILYIYLFTDFNG